MIRLRPHHLLCLLTYAGKGYTPAFTANFDAIAERLNGGEAIAVVDGPDDICAPLLDDPDAHCRRDSVTARDRLAAEALSGFLENAGTLPDIAALRSAFAAGTIRTACAGCEWSGLCSDIAASGFAGTRVK